MFDNHLLQACIQQQQTLEAMVTPPATLGREALMDAVQVFVNHTDLLERTQRRLMFKAGRSNHPDSQSIGTRISSLIEAAIALGRILSNAVGNDAIFDPAGPVERAVPLSKALQRLNQLLDVHLKSWPQDRLPESVEVAEADRRGETLDPEEAFADILHLDADAWSELVAKHRSGKGLRHAVDR